MLTSVMLRWRWICLSSLPVKRVGLYCEKTAPVSASSTNIVCCVFKEIPGNVDHRTIVVTSQLVLSKALALDQFPTLSPPPTYIRSTLGTL